MSWTTAARYANCALNTRPWLGTQHSPYELMFGRKPRFPFDHDIQTKRPIKLSSDDLLRTSSAYANNCSAMVEDAIIKSQRMNRFKADQELYSLVYHPGDLVLMHIPRVKKGISSRLRYQTTGPYEILEHQTSARRNQDGTYNTYRIKHLGSGQQTTANVRQLLPYISRQAHDVNQFEENETRPSPTPLNKESTNEAFDPQPKDFVLLPNQDGVPYHLLQITHRDGRTVEAQYLNTSQGRRERGFKLCWEHPDKPEIQSNTKPPQKNYGPFIDDFTIEEFCQRCIAPSSLGSGRNQCWNLNKKEIQKTLQQQPL